MQLLCHLNLAIAIRAPVAPVGLDVVTYRRVIKLAQVIDMIFHNLPRAFCKTTQTYINHEFN
jgi:hypothetical protein